MSIVVNTLTTANRKLCAFLERVAPSLDDEDMDALEALMDELEASIDVMEVNVIIKAMREGTSDTTIYALLKRLADLEYAMVGMQHRLILKQVTDKFVLEKYCRDFINYATIKEQLADAIIGAAK
jgi:translation initiation factor IF-2